MRRSLSLGDVENITKIRSKYLEAMEENDFEVFSNDTAAELFDANRV